MCIKTIGLAILCEKWRQVSVIGYVARVSDEGVIGINIPNISV
jgi:hypothetical protein